MIESGSTLRTMLSLIMLLKKPKLNLLKWQMLPKIKKRKWKRLSIKKRILMIVNQSRRTKRNITSMLLMYKKNLKKVRRNTNHKARVKVVVNLNHRTPAVLNQSQKVRKNQRRNLTNISLKSIKLRRQRKLRRQKKINMKRYQNTKINQSKSQRYNHWWQRKKL